MYSFGAYHHCSFYLWTAICCRRWSADYDYTVCVVVLFTSDAFRLKRSLKAQSNENISSAPGFNRDTEQPIVCNISVNIFKNLFGLLDSGDACWTGFPKKQPEQNTHGTVHFKKHPLGLKSAKAKQPVTISNFLDIFHKRLQKTFFLQIGQYGYQKRQNCMLIPNPKTKLKKHKKRNFQKTVFLVDFKK